MLLELANSQSGSTAIFPGAGIPKGERYVNPFYGVAHKYLPYTNIDHMLWWANHFLLRFGFYRAALFRISNYFITTLNIECEDAQAKKKYEEAFESMQWKQVLAMSGLNLLAYSNLFVSVNQGFERFLSCPKCSKITRIDKASDYKFSEKAEYLYRCPHCKVEHKHEVLDRPSKDLDKVSVTFWSPREIITRYEETTGESEYYWRIPEEYKKKVLKKDNRFYSKKTPRVVYDSILQDRLLAFNSRNFIHVKMPTPVGIKTDGKSIPLCMYLFDDFFMLKVLQRFNEAICFEDIVPFRVIAMGSESNSQANPILHQSGGAWQGAVQRMIEEHRRDPGAYHTFPFPLDYKQLGGEGKNLAPIEMINAAVANILNAFNIPQELYTMTLQVQSLGPALRLFENSWAVLVDTYNHILNHWGEVIGKIKGLPKAKIGLTPVTISDDIERKSIIGQLVSANAIARSELLSMYGFDYREQIRKKMQEDRDVKELQEEEQAKEQLRQFADMGGSQGGQPTSPQDVLSQAQQIAQELFPMDAAGRRQKLQELKVADATLYGAVKQALEELTSQARSQGAAQAKQQAGQPQ